MCSFNPSKVKKGIQWVGNQDDALWVLNQSVHINADGDQIPLDESPYSWQPIGGPTIEQDFYCPSRSILVPSESILI